MRVGVTGGTGFVGPAIVQELLDAGHEVVVLEHRTRAPVPDHPRLVRRSGVDVADRESLRGAFDGCDAVVHLVAILREKPNKGLTFERVHVQGTRNVVEEAKAAGVRRFLLMSANGVGDPSMPDTPYFRTKAEMERVVKEAGFAWTIFRPSSIAAGAEGGFDDKFADIVRKTPVLPSFAGGDFEVQPVSRHNVAQAFARALERPETEGRVYELVGPERFTWNEYLERLSGVLGKKRVKAPVPGWFARGLAKGLGPLFPADESQLRMLMAGNVGDPEPAVHDFDLRLETWGEAVRGLDEQD